MLKHSALSSSGISKPQFASGKGLKKRNLKPRKRPAWDSTVNDLSALKSTPEEMDRRRKVHQSQNIDLVKQEKLRKHVAKLHQERLMETSLQNMRFPNRMLKDLQSGGGNNIFDALETSDRLMAAVKDLLGDHTKKYQGLPHVTKAPNHSDFDRSLPEMAEILSQLDLNSESVMDKSALNDVGDDQDSFTSTNSSRDERSSLDGFYKPKMDLDRFKQLIREADLDRMMKTHLATLDDSAPATGARNHEKKVKSNGTRDLSTRRNLDLETKSIGKRNGSTRSNGRHGESGSSRQTERSMMERGGGDGWPAVASPRTQAAMNDTVRVEGMRSVLANHNINNSNSQVATQLSSMDDFNQMLEAIQINLAQCETPTSSATSFKSVQRPSSYTGYTTALLETIARMSSHMAQNETRSRADKATSEELSREVNRLHGLVDALTADIIAMQEEYSRMKNDLVKHKRDTEIHWMLLSQSLTPYGIHIQLPIQPPPMTNYEEPPPRNDCFARPPVQQHQQQLPVSLATQQRPVFQQDCQAKPTQRQVVMNTAPAPESIAEVVVRSDQTQRNQHYFSGHDRQDLEHVVVQPHQPRGATAPSAAGVVASPAAAVVESAAATGQLLGYADLHNQRAFDSRREEIRRQMVELNRQRQIAQSKVDELKRQSQMPKVSPSISPITVSSEADGTDFTNRSTRVSHDGAQVVMTAEENRVPRRLIDVKMPSMSDDFDQVERQTVSSQNSSQNKQLVQDNLWL